MACIDTEEGVDVLEVKLQWTGYKRSSKYCSREKPTVWNMHLFKSWEAKEWKEVGYPTNSDEVDFDTSIDMKLKYTLTLSLSHTHTHTQTHTHAHTHIDNFLVMQSHE